MLVIKIDAYATYLIGANIISCDIMKQLPFKGKGIDKDLHVGV